MPEAKSEKVANVAIQEPQARRAFYRGCPLIECSTVSVEKGESELRMKERKRKAEKRARETVEEACTRKTRNRQCQAEKRARQTDEQANKRRACIRECMAKKQSSETDKQADDRRACVRECMAKK